LKLLVGFQGLSWTGYSSRP